MNSPIETTGKPTLRIVVPFRNDEGNVALLLRKLRGEGEPLGVPCDVIPCILVGIIGAYLGRVLETLKNCPRFIVQDRLGFRGYP